MVDGKLVTLPRAPRLRRPDLLNERLNPGVSVNPDRHSRQRILIAAAVIRSNYKMQNPTALSAPAAAVIASSALLLPAVVSASSTPTPNHPQILRWYKSLREPRFKPPDALIPVAWTAIDTALAIAGYRLLRASPSAARKKALALWGWNVAMIGGWSRLFFKRQNLPLSTVAAAGLAVTGVAFVNQARRVDKTAARAGLPLVGWVAFATVLTATIWRLNSRRRN